MRSGIRQFALTVSVWLGSASVALAAGGSHGHEDAHHAEGGSEGLPQFDPSSWPSQIFWLAVAFLVLYIFFSRKTLPEISGVIENRRVHIQSDLDSADSLTNQAEEVQTAYEESLEKAREDASGIIIEVEDAMKAKAANEFEAFRQRSEKESGNAEKRIQKARAEAMDQMNTIAAEVAAEAARQIAGIPVDAKSVEAVVRKLNNGKEKAKAA